MLPLMTLGQEIRSSYSTAPGPTWACYWHHTQHVTVKVKVIIYNSHQNRTTGFRAVGFQKSFFLANMSTGLYLSVCQPY